MDWFTIMYIALRIVFLAFVILLIARIAMEFQGRRRDDAMAALERRFVAGDVSEEDYRHMRDTLKS